jgi:hypothetical protein
VASWGSGDPKQAMVGRGCEHEPGSRPDPHPAFSGACVWIGASGAFLCTDGLASYPKAAIHLFREPLRSGRVGRPRLILPEGVMIAQVIKRYARQRVLDVVRRVVRGANEVIVGRLRATQGSEEAVINTAYIERLQATFRSRLAALVRRSRAPVRLRETLEAGMWLVGTCYNFCWTHESMRRERQRSDLPGGKWVQSTPAQAAGLADHRWSVEELLSFCVPPSEITKWRGRLPKWLVEAARVPHRLLLDRDSYFTPIRIPF